MCLACSAGIHLPQPGLAKLRSVRCLTGEACGDLGKIVVIEEGRSTRVGSPLCWINKLNLTGVYPCVCRMVGLSESSWRLQLAGTQRLQRVAYFTTAAAFKRWRAKPRVRHLQSAQLWMSLSLKKHYIIDWLKTDFGLEVMASKWSEKANEVSWFEFAFYFMAHAESLWRMKC